MKEWYLLINEKREGPFSFQELKDNPQVTPDTLAWKKGMHGWVAIRHIPELKELFQDKPESKPLHDDENKPISPDLLQEEALTLQRDPSQFFLWLLIIILIILYLTYQIKRF